MIEYLGPCMQILAGCGDGYIVEWTHEKVRAEYSAVATTSGSVAALTGLDANGSFYSATTAGALFQHQGSLTGANRLLLQAHQHDVLAIAFAPESSSTFVTCCADGSIALWDLQSAGMAMLQQRFVQRVGAAMCGVLVDASLAIIGFGGGQLLAFQLDAHLTPLWEQPEAHAHGAAPGVSCVAISGDRKTMVTGGVAGDVRVWALGSRRLVCSPFEQEHHVAPLKQLSGTINDKINLLFPKRSKVNIS
jgi:WD40 repeat protein